MTDDGHAADYQDVQHDGDGFLADVEDVAEPDGDDAGQVAGPVDVEDVVQDVTEDVPEAALFDAPESFDVQGVEEFLADVPDGETLRPALQRLTTDQRTLIGSFVDGFDSRSAFLSWCQDAAVATLGEVGGDWVQTRAFTRLDLSVLVTSDARTRYAPDSGRVLSRRQAAGVRRGVVLGDLLPACRSAYRRLRWSATEYVNDGDDSFIPDPALQDHTAMRPALTELDRRQDWALRVLLDGLPSEDALLSWLQVVTEASYAEVPDLGRRLNRERRARRYLLDDVEDADRDVARWFRESFAAKYVLPGFATAASEVGRRAGELAENQSDGLSFPEMG